MLIHNLYQVPNIWQEYLCWSFSFNFWVCHFLLHREVKKPNFLERMSADFENIGSFYISLEHFKSACQQNCWSISFEGECHFYTPFELCQVGQNRILLTRKKTLPNKIGTENSKKYLLPFFRRFYVSSKEMDSKQHFQNLPNHYFRGINNNKSAVSK